MKLACLDCLLAVQNRLAEKKKAQDLVLAGENGIQQAQYFEGEIVALEFVQKFMQKALNRETKQEGRP